MSHSADTSQQIIPASYNNEAKRIHIPGLPAKMIPGSPQDLQMPIGPSGNLTPFSGIGTPAGTNTPTRGEQDGGGLPLRFPRAHPST